MKLYILFSLAGIIFHLSESIEIQLELQRNILNFGYCVNYKYEGMLAHLFDRFYVVTKFMLPMIGDIKISRLNFDDTCAYMNKEYASNMDSRKYLTELRTYCNKIKPFVSYYSKLIDSYNKTAYNILQSTKISFSIQIVNIFMFTSSIISIITIMLVIYSFCKHKHIRTIIASLILHKTKEVEANSNSNSETNNYECRTLAYIGMVLTALSMITVIFLLYRKSKLCRAYRFSNIIKIVLFISDVQNYIPIKLCKTSDSIHLFKIKGTLKPRDIKLNRNYFWDTLEINWNKIILTFNDNKIDLPRIITIKM